jgi:CYTH domain-containing protein
LIEIERKFLIKDIPLRKVNYKPTTIEQGYLSFVPEIRIRHEDKYGHRYTLTIKEGKGLSKSP